MKMFQKKLLPKKTGKIKITNAVLVVFCLAQMVASTAQASANGANFFETAANNAVDSISSFAVKAEEIAKSIGDNLRGGASAAAEGLQNETYAAADRLWLSGTHNAADSDKISQSGSGMAKADLASFFERVKCFFGFGCETAKTAENAKTTTEPRMQAPTQAPIPTPAGFEKGLTPATAGDRPSNTDVSAEPEAIIQTGGTDGVQIKDGPPRTQAEEIKTVTIIQPIKEIQTIHTVTNNTNTVVADEDMKAKLNLLLRQMDSDRPSFSLGQSFTMPSNLSGKTLNIGLGNFSVDNEGNVNAQTLTTAGNVIVQGNFTVSGAQTFSGATALNAATVGPLFAIDQTGAGAALRADNLTFKDFTISTDETDAAILLDPNGTGAVQFHSTGNYIDSSGNLVLAGGITAASLNAGAGAIQTTGAISGGIFNGLTLTGLATGFTIAGGTASKTLTLNNSLGFSGGDGKTFNMGANNITLSSSGDVVLSLPTSGTVTALGNTITGSGSVVLQTSPSLTTPSLGVATAASINKLAITAPAASATLTIADGKTFTASNTLTLTGNDGASLAIGAGGTLGTGAYAAIANYATLANPIFTGTVTIPGPFTLGATSVTASGVQLNYLAGASGITGTANLVFSNSPVLVTPSLGVASATSLSTPSLTTASGDLALDPFGNVVIKGSTADNTTGALSVTNSAPTNLLFVRNDGNIGINNILPGRKLDIAENTGWTPQIRLTNDASNYAEMYVNSTGNLFLDATGSGATNISILDQNLKVCAGGGMGADSCPAAEFITGTGNLVVEGQVAAADYQRICPTGYIWVPGSAKYGTMPGFCVMKYEAKNVGGVATSQTASTPWTSITQIAARSACRALGAGYHLISEAEWMTIADNAANTGSNWFGGTVGANFMYSGHNDNNPADKLAASTDDDGYYGTGDSVSACDGSYNNFVVGDDTITGRACAGQKRTLALSNGNVIWDISGNVYEWTDAYIYSNGTTTEEMPLPATGWIEYTAVTNYKGLNYLRPQDASWSATQSIGRIYTDSNCAYGSNGAGGYDEICGVYDHYYHAFIRGGNWYNGAYAGPFTLLLNYSPSDVYDSFGFRCAR